MAKIDFNKIPRFSQLPVKPGAPPDSNWGVFGDDDEVGCINFLTEDGIIEAAKLVRKGKVFRLDTPINFATPPLFDRPEARDGGSAKAQGLRYRGQPRNGRMVVGQSRRRDRHRLSGGRSVAVGFQGSRCAPLSNALTARASARRTVRAR